MTRKEQSLLMWILFIIIIAVIASACGPAYHLKRAEHHIGKAIKKGADINKDTVFQQIKIPVPQVKTDTIFQTKDGDTVIIEKDRLLIRYIDRPGDTVEIHGECKSDTIYKEVPVTVTREIHAPKKGNPWKWIALAFGLVLVLGAILQRR